MKSAIVYTCTAAAVVTVCIATKDVVTTPKPITSAPTTLPTTDSGKVPVGIALSGNPKVTCTVGAVDPVKPECFDERFIQPIRPKVNQIDFLIVTDSSGSMNEERKKIAMGFKNFVKSIPKYLDYRVAVLLGHGSRSQFSGKLWRYNRSDAAVLDSTQDPTGYIQAKLKNKLMNTADDVDADGEEGFYSLTQLLKPANLSLARQQGFFRKDAGLVVVFVSDENDTCQDFPNRWSIKRDPSGYERRAYLRDCKDKGINDKSVYALLKQLQGNRPLAIGSIGHDEKFVIPRNSYDSPSWGLIEIAKNNHGIFMDIDQPSYERDLERLGELVTKNVELQTEFKLSRQGVDPSTIKVKVDGYAAEFEYNAEKNEVFVKDPGRQNSVIDIDYCMPKPIPSPAPTVCVTESPSPSPSCEPSSSPSPSPSVTVTAEPSPSPSVTATSEPSPSPTVTATSEPSPSPTVTATSEPSPSPTVTATSEPSPSPTVTATSEPSPSPTVTATSEPSPSPTVTATSEPSPSPTVTATSEPSPSPTVTATSEPSPSPTVTATSEPSPSPTVTATSEPSPSPTVTATSEPSPSPTATSTPSPSPSPSASPSGPINVIGI